MRKLRAVWIRLLGMVRTRVDEEFSAELEAHIAMQVEDGVRAGLSEEEARRRALIQLGGVEQAKQARRDGRTLPWVENVARDFRYAVRTLSKHPAITLVAVISIGLGIGANATIFAMVSRFVLRPAPVGDPATLLSLHIAPKGDPCCNEFPLPVYEDIRDQAKSFSGVAAIYELLPASLSGGGEPERVWGQAVTPNFFDVLRVPMVAGRGFAEQENRSPDVVLSARLWQRRFASDPQIVGKTVKLSGKAFTVIGIAPGSLRSVDQILDIEFWVPLQLAPELAADTPPQNSREYHWLAVAARLRDGVTRSEAASELDTMAHRFAAEYPKTDKDMAFRFEQAGSLPPRERNAVLTFLAALSAIVVLLLAIAGANVANLLFAKAAGRQREMAVRLALGATRARLRRQMLMESTLLGVAGGVLGVLLSLWSTQALSAFHVPEPIPLNVFVALDWRTLAYTLVVSIGCGVLLGMPPAWAASRPLLANALKGEDALARPGRRVTLRNVLVVAQVAMSVVLLCVTGLFLRSLESAARIDLGFRPQGLLLMSMDPRLNGYTPEQISRFMRGIPILRGHDIGEVAANGPRVAVVNKSFADRLFPGGDPIGQHVHGGSWTYEIVGVVGNTKSRTIGEDTRAVLYRSLDQSIAEDPSGMGYTLLVHTAGNPAALSEAVRRQIYGLDKNLAIYNEQTMEEHVKSAYFLPRLAATLFGVFGGMGLLLTAVGLYGVMSYAVSKRTREIGIRMALGARAGNVAALVVRQGMVLALIAMLLGWPVAWMIVRFASSFLYGIEPHDAVTFVAAPVFLAAVALIACWLPARRAALVDPVKALRTE